MKTRHLALVLATALSVLFVAVACQQAAAPAAPAPTKAAAAAAAPTTAAAAAPTTAAAPAATQPAAPATGPAQELKVGVGTPLSGTSAELGQMLGRTYEMAAADIGTFTVGGKNYKWKPVVEDNLYTSAGGVQTANKFINQENVKLMFQLGTAPVTAVQPLAEAAKVIYDGASSAPSFLAPKFKYSFRAYQTPADTYPAAIGWLVKNQPQLKNWYILVADDSTGTALLDSSRPVVKYYGLNLVGEAQYPRETTDFYPTLVKVLPTKPDMIITMSGGASATLVKQAREQGYTGKFLTSSMPPNVVQISGAKAVDGWMSPVPDLWSDKTPKPLVDFANKYRAKYNAEFVGNGLIALPTLFTVTDAMKKAGTVDDTDKIINVMETQKLETPFGTMFYGEKEAYGTPHQLVWPVWLSEYQNGGKLNTIATVSPDDALKAIVDVLKK